jgi:hypothetical protein
MRHSSQPGAGNRTFLMSQNRTFLKSPNTKRIDSWHLWCGVALVCFSGLVFRFCYISTGKAADLSTGYPLF